MSTSFVGDRPPHVPLGPRSGSTTSSSNPASPTPLPQQFYPPLPPTASVPPLISLELRIRWLEALISGLDTRNNHRGRTQTKGKDIKGLLHMTQDVQRELEEILEANDSLRRFMNTYEEYEQILAPMFASSPLGPANAPSFDELSPVEFEVLLKELEPDIRSADQDLREIQALDKRGVAGTGKLLEHEELKPRLAALIRNQVEIDERRKVLDARLSSLMQRYTTHVNALSELFVIWNDLIRDAEEHSVFLLKRRSEKEKLGFV
ncbi:uncharacterized protein EI90DRAFT_3063759 [Cantharellus anzutake]|uniref:uncharacterized protein n=1 Tax=Cantharellus anzutake TaxID=1750568 RepID=UPI00190350E6|nr:uncharacterized protein EI90DRAFT_3063759 [Cantharellus anzutake]KAF8328841.1 hypothetical protein EI90DRAFT_3063759 [Cantharellus anzutake]